MSFCTKREVWGLDQLENNFQIHRFRSKPFLKFPLKSPQLTCRITLSCYARISPSLKSFHRIQGNQGGNNIHAQDAFSIRSLDEVAGYRAKNVWAEWVKLICSLFSDNVQFWASVLWRGCQPAVPPNTLPTYVWAESESSFWNRLEGFVTVTTDQTRELQCSVLSHYLLLSKCWPVWVKKKSLNV